jgi:hypothetical protein
MEIAGRDRWFEGGGVSHLVEVSRTVCVRGTVVNVKNGEKFWGKEKWGEISGEMR